MSNPDREYMLSQADKVEKLRDALQFLVNLKEYKDANGKDTYYTEAQPRAWESAREVLSDE